MQTNHFKLYLLVLILIAGVVLASVGGGLFAQQQPWFAQWQHQLFQQMCHQMPDRSFWINGQPMAVCSRCFGIYSGFLLGWILLPAIAFRGAVSLSVSKKIVAAAVVINLVDLVGNMIGFWQNILISRLILGWLAGTSATILFSGAFFKNKQHKEQHYGRVNISGTAK